MDLLSKTRKINAMLQDTGAKPVNFKEMADTLSEVIEANVFVVSRRKIARFCNYTTNRK